MFLSRLTRLQTCCGFISLKLGCLITGYFELSGNLYGIYRASTGEDDWEDVILYLLGAGFLAFINVLLIWGVHKERKKLILPWLIFKFIAYLGLTIYYGVRIVETGFLIPQIEQGNLQIFIIAFCCVFTSLLLLAWYTFFCVYSFYKTGIKTEVKVETQEEKKEEKGAKEKKDE